MPDLTVMHDTASYMQDHADHSHHAKEDIIYRKLSECGDEQKAAAVTLLMDHETISKKSEALVRSINEAQLELSKDNQKMLRLRCEDYIASMRKHMDYGESQVFPLVLESLSAEDWADIIPSIQPDADPLFGSTITALCTFARGCQSRHGACRRGCRHGRVSRLRSRHGKFWGLFLASATPWQRPSLCISNKPTPVIWLLAASYGKRVQPILEITVALPWTVYLITTTPV